MSKYFLISFFALFLYGCASAPSVYNMSQEYIPTLENGGSPSLGQVEKAILSASYKCGWIPRRVKPGLIEARITVRSHRASVEIPYSTGSYSILYKDSHNLDYKNGRIHGNYNKWVRRLSGYIQRELAARVLNLSVGPE